MIDLLIAGGGPIGLATALYGARAGLDVAVVEPRPMPIDKACGEGLMPGAVRRLTSLGVTPTGVPFRGISYVSGTESAQAVFERGTGMGVRRIELHDVLWGAATAAGIPIHRGRIDSIAQNADCVSANGFRARYLAAADGLHSQVRDRLGLHVPDGRTRRWGLRRHYAIEPWSSFVEVHWSPVAEAYVTPVARNCVGVAILSGQQAPFTEQIRNFPELQCRLKDVPGGRVRGAGPLRQRSRQVVAGRVLLVGDSAGYVDALTGEGISVGMACAESLVAAVSSGRPADYERTWRAASRRYRVITSALLRARSVPGVPERIVPAAAKLPWAFRWVVDQLAQ